MNTSELLNDKQGSSLHRHKYDADVFRARLTEGGIKQSITYRFAYSDFGYESQTVTRYDDTIRRKLPNIADKHERIERLQLLIAEIKQDIKSAGILERLRLNRDLQNAERTLKRLVEFDLNANRKAVSRFVTLHNFDKLRPHQVKQLDRAKVEYEKQLRLANLCPKCLLPIKTERLQIVEVVPTEAQKQLIAQGQLELVQSQLADTAQKVWIDLKKQGKRNRKLKYGVGYKYVKVTTTEVAEVSTHYRAFQFTDKNGKVKLYYGLIDGTKYNGQLLPMKVVKGQLGNEYYSIPDLLKLNGIPCDSYKVRDIKCECN